jgi:hypothetical protein
LNKGKDLLAILEQYTHKEGTKFYFDVYDPETFELKKRLEENGVPFLKLYEIKFNKINGLLFIRMMSNIRIY